MRYICAIFLIGAMLIGTPVPIVHASDKKAMIAQAKAFLDAAKGTWMDWNVPYLDGMILHDKIVSTGAKNILEIGTSTGHSTIWLAMAAIQTGGKVTTIEIDKRRHDIALQNFEKAGVSDVIDAVLGDAHIIVPDLKQQFDFVFSDADKGWYIQYFKDIRSNLNTGGCVAAHNVLRRSGNMVKYLEYVQAQEGFATNIIEGSGEGIAFTCKN